MELKSEWVPSTNKQRGLIIVGGTVLTNIIMTTTNMTWEIKGSLIWTNAGPLIP